MFIRIKNWIKNIVEIEDVLKVNFVFFNFNANFFLIFVCLSFFKLQYYLIEFIYFLCDSEKVIDWCIKTWCLVKSLALHSAEVHHVWQYWQRYVASPSLQCNIVVDKGLSPQNVLQNRLGSGHRMLIRIMKLFALSVIF